MRTILQAGSCLAHGPVASLALVREAVRGALQRAQPAAQDVQGVSCLLLFLTEEFIPHITNALQCAMREASCTNVHGCTAPALLTHEGYVMDTPAAACMVICGAALQTLRATDIAAPRLCLIPAASTLNSHWLNADDALRALRLGTAVGDTGNPDNQNIWHAGRLLFDSHEPLELIFNRGKMRYCTATDAQSGMLQDLNSLAASLGRAPHFGLLLPGLRQALSIAGALDRQLTEIRQVFPGLPLIGLFNPLSPGHIAPRAEGGHAISPENNLLILLIQQQEPGLDPGLEPGLDPGTGCHV
jgi:hypothetical protein